MATNHPLVELTMSRFREFLREPEAVFWVFAFPIIMTCALGVAFRSSGDEPVIVGVVQGARAGDVTAALERAGDSRSGPIATRRHRARRPRRPRRRWSSKPAIRPSITSTRRAPRVRPRGWPWTRRCSTRRAGPTRSLPAQRPVDGVGSRYIDWLVPGLLGMNIMSTGLWGVGFSIVNARTKKLLKRLVATPMSRAHYLASHVLSRLVFLGARSDGAGRLRLDRVRRRRARLARGAGRHRARSARWRSAGMALLVSSRARTIEAVSGLHERGDAADVGAVGRVFRVEQLSRTRCSRSSRRCR